MKNVNPYMKKTCIYLRGDDFEKLMRKIFGDEIEIEWALEGSGVSIYRTNTATNEDINDYDIIKELSKYFDTTVLSFHTDCYESVGVWIVYMDT